MGAHWARSYHTNNQSKVERSDEITHLFCNPWTSQIVHVVHVLDMVLNAA